TPRDISTCPSCEAVSRSNASSRQPLVARSRRWTRKIGRPSCSRRRSARKSDSPPASLLSWTISPAGLLTTASASSMWSSCSVAAGSGDGGIGSMAGRAWSAAPRPRRAQRPQSADGGDPRECGHAEQARTAGFQRIQQGRDDQQPGAEDGRDRAPLRTLQCAGQRAQVVRLHVQCMLALDLLLQPQVQQARHLRRMRNELGQALAEFAGQALRAVAFDQDLLQYRLRHLPDVDLRIELAAEALDVEQGLLQQDQLRLQGELVALRRAEQLDQYLGQRDLRQRPGEV